MTQPATILCWHPPKLWDLLHETNAADIEVPA